MFKIISDRLRCWNRYRHSYCYYPVLCARASSRQPILLSTWSLHAQWTVDLLRKCFYVHTRRSPRRERMSAVLRTVQQNGMFPQRLLQRFARLQDVLPRQQGQLQ